MWLDGVDAARGDNETIGFEANPDFEPDDITGVGLRMLRFG